MDLFGKSGFSTSIFGGAAKDAPKDAESPARGSSPSASAAAAGRSGGPGGGGTSAGPGAASGRESTELTLTSSSRSLSAKDSSDDLVLVERLDEQAQGNDGSVAPGSRRSSQDTIWGGELRSEFRLIDKFEQVPSFTALLTKGLKTVARLPAELEPYMAAIETGPRRAVILYCPQAAQRNKDVMSKAVANLRAKLVAAGYALPDRGDMPAKSEVIRLLYADHQQRNGAAGSTADTKVKSQAKNRFMSWLDIAVRERATDIHVQVTNARTLVQLRVDGELEPLRDERNGVYTESEGMEAIAWPFNSAAAKGSNSQAQWDATRNLYCMTEPRTVGSSSVVLRYQSLRGYLGPKMIARILNVDLQAPTLTYDQLGYAPSQRQLLQDVANMPSGFVLFAGVTGSGKTTTLKTFVETHPGQGNMAMYSIEDPVEYPLRGVHQIVLQRDLTDVEGSLRQYNETVASLLRSDPDIVIVGELRDLASARAGQQIVETGHMALGTVHAHLISGIIPRLTNEEIGMSRDVLTHPNMLSALCYQALVPKLCPHCSLTYTGVLQQLRDSGSFVVDGKPLSSAGNSFEELDLIVQVRQAIDERFNVSTEGLRFRNHAGCERCNHRGTSGVTVVAEMMIPDRRWLELTRDGRDYEAMMHYRQMSDGKFDSADMTGKTVLEHTLFKALGGTVDPRNCQRFDSLKRFDLGPRHNANGPILARA
jgi:general secretion pathway protein E